jgi:aryl sulfotransferase
MPATERRQYRTAVHDTTRWEGFVHRPGDIFVCTPPKCGTTWMQTIVAHLLWPEGDMPGPVLALSPWIEMTLTPAPEMHALLEAQRHRRFMKSHTPADGIPWFPTARYVTVVRDGRDAFMSLCNHVERFRNDVRDYLNAQAEAGVPQMLAWNGDLHEFFARWLADDDLLLHHVATFWERRREPNLLLVHYNDLKANLAGEMRRVARFLELEVPEARWPAVVEACTFESMRARGNEIGAFDMIFEGGAESFIFKGTNGRWRDVLTPDELAAYARRVAETLPPAAAAWLERGRAALAG